MEKYIILADSCMDLDKAQREEYGIENQVRGTIIYPNGEEQTADLDWEKISFEEFFHMLENKKNHFRSSLPNQFSIIERYEEYLKKGQDILVVTLSGAMSGTYSSFTTAKNEIIDKYPGRQILIVDSRKYSAGINMICLLASENRAKGMSIEENFKDLEERKTHIHQIGILDDLFFLYRSGRISKAKAFFGNLAGVKPMADFSIESGMPCTLGNARGYKAAYKAIEKYLKHFIGSTKGKTLIVTHSIRQAQADAIYEIAKRIAPDAKVICCRMNQSNGVNVGPGLAACWFVSDDRVSPNCEVERKVMADILANK